MPQGEASVTVFTPPGEVRALLENAERLGAIMAGFTGARSSDTPLREGSRLVMVSTLGESEAVVTAFTDARFEFLVDAGQESERGAAFALEPAPEGTRVTLRIQSRHLGPDRELQKVEDGYRRWAQTNLKHLKNALEGDRP